MVSCGLTLTFLLLAYQILNQIIAILNQAKTHAHKQNPRSAFQKTRKHKGQNYLMTQLSQLHSGTHLFSNSKNKKQSPSNFLLCSCCFVLFLIFTFSTVLKDLRHHFEAVRSQQAALNHRSPEC